MNVVMATMITLLDRQLKMAFSPPPNTTSMLTKRLGQQPMTCRPKSLDAYNLLKIDLKELDGWGILNQHKSPGAINFQHDSDRMQVDPSEEGSGSCPTSYTIIV
jgi:hypothetical protein